MNANKSCNKKCRMLSSNRVDSCHSITVSITVVSMSSDHFKFFKLEPIAVNAKQNKEVEDGEL